MAMAVSYTATAVMVQEGVHPESGIRVTKYKDILTGQSTIDIIFKLENLEEPEWLHYEDPCTLIDKVAGWLKSQMRSPSSLAESVEEAMNKMCVSYRHVRQTQMGISQAYGLEIKKHVDILRAMRPRKRATRSIGRSIRRFFGIAGAKEQSELQMKVEAITRTLFTQHGTLVNLTYVVAQQNQRLDRLESAMDSYANALNSTIVLVNSMVDSINMNMVITNTRVKLLQQVIALGNSQHHVMSLHTNLLRQRAEGMMALARGQLSPYLVSPLELQRTLERLDGALDEQFPQMEHLKYNPYEFYSSTTAVGYRGSRNVYVLIKIPLDFADQQFAMYELEPFPVIVPNNEYATLITPEHKYVAVSNIHSAYFTLDRSYIDEYCTGHDVMRCAHLQLQRHIEKSPSCETALATANTTQMVELCPIVMISKEQLEPMVLEINDTFLFFVNPTNEKFYLDCPNSRHLKFLSSMTQFTTRVPCFCQIISLTVATPTVFHQHCLDFESEEPAVCGHENAILIALVAALAPRKEENATLVIPDQAEVKYPEISRKWGQKMVLDAKQLVGQTYDQYKYSLYGQITSNAEAISSARISWFMPSLGTVIAVICVVVLIIVALVFKYNKLASMFTVMNMVRGTDAAMMGVNTPLLISLEIVMIVFCVLLLIFFCTRYFQSIKRVYRNFVSCCCESLELYRPPAAKVLLYIGNLTSYVYLHVGQLHTIPHLVTLQTNGEEIELTLHRSCINGFVTLSAHNLTLCTGEFSFKLPSALSVPLYLQSTVDRLLRNHPIQVQLLVGQDGVYRTFTIPCRPASRPVASPARNAQDDDYKELEPLNA